MGKFEVTSHNLEEDVRFTWKFPEDKSSRWSREVWYECCDAADPSFADGKCSWRLIQSDVGRLREQSSGRKEKPVP